MRSEIPEEDRRESVLLDFQLGPRIAFGTAPGPELLDWLDEQGHDWLLGADTPMLALTGGTHDPRSARLERALANLIRELAA